MAFPADFSRLSRLAAAVAKGGLGGVRHPDAFRVRRGIGGVTGVPVPPFVRPDLGVALGRVLPPLLTPERRRDEAAPDATPRVVAAAVSEVGAEEERATPHAEVVGIRRTHADAAAHTVRYVRPQNF